MSINWICSCVLHTSSDTVYRGRSSPHANTYLSKGLIPIASESRKSWNFQEEGQEFASPRRSLLPIHGGASAGRKDSGFPPKVRKNTFLRQKKLIRVNTENRNEKKHKGFLCCQSDLSLFSNGRNIKSPGIYEDLYNAILHPHAKYGGLDNSIPQLNYSMQMPEPLAF